MTQKKVAFCSVVETLESSTHPGTNHKCQLFSKSQFWNQAQSWITLLMDSIDLTWVMLNWEKLLMTHAKRQMHTNSSTILTCSQKAMILQSVKEVWSFQVDKSRGLPLQELFSESQRSFCLTRLLQPLMLRANPWFKKPWTNWSNKAYLQLLLSLIDSQLLEMPTKLLSLNTVKLLRSAPTASFWRTKTVNTRNLFPDNSRKTRECKEKVWLLTRNINQTWMKFQMKEIEIISMS